MRSLGSLSQIIVFAKIAELGSLSSAARELNLTPSAVSKSLSQLEEHIGVLLIKRTTRSLALTEHGKSFLERVSILLNEVEETFAQASSFREEPRGTLKITTSMAFGYAQAPKLIGRYMEQYPEVVTRVALDDRFVNLSEQDCDIALRIAASSDWTYEARKVTDIHWVYCASPDYIERFGPLTHPTNLERHRCLIYPAMTLNGAWAFRDSSVIHEVPIRGSLISNSSLILLEAAVDGQGVACLPTYIVAKRILDGELSIVFPTFRAAISHTLYAMFFQRKYSSPLIRSFVDFAVKEFGPIAPWDLSLKGKIEF
jgi:DNA-binding transcriptional LysR family regulator